MLAELGGGEMDGGVEPVEGAGDEGEPVEEKVALFDVGEFVQKDVADLRGREMGGGEVGGENEARGEEPGEGGGGDLVGGGDAEWVAEAEGGAAGG